MSDVRVLLGSLLVGVGGAVLIAALVLGRSGQAEAIEFASLDDGGVLVIRTETYQRHGAKADLIAGLVAGGDLYLFPERYVTEAWALLAPQGEILEAVTVAWLDNGELLQRTRLIGQEVLIERPGLESSNRETLRGEGRGVLGVLPSEFLAEAKADFERRIDEGWELVATPEAGTLMLVRPRSVDAGELESLRVAGYSVPYYGDLPVRMIVVELTMTEDFWPVSEERWAVLDDATRVLVESRRTTIEARPKWEWRWFEARVWGE